MGENDLMQKNVHQISAALRDTQYHVVLVHHKVLAQEVPSSIPKQETKGMAIREILRREVFQKRQFERWDSPVLFVK